MSAVNPIYWLFLERCAVPAHYDWLCKSEKDILSSFRFTKKRNDWLLGRWTAKHLIVQLTRGKLSESDIEILPSDSGAPEVSIQNSSNPVELSISHSSDHSFCIASLQKGSIGCDMEKIQARTHKFEEDYFTSCERRRLEHTNQQEHAILSNLIWCGKEAVFKALKTGLRRDTRSVEVSIPEYWSSGSWNRTEVIDNKQNQLYEGQFMIENDFVFFVASERAREIINVKN